MNEVKREGGKAPAGRRKTWKLALIALVSLAILGGGGFAYYRWGPGAKTESAYITATVQRGDIEDQVSATGSLQPRDYVDVGAQVSGQLRKIHVEVGSEVKEGDLLAEIDAETSQARVDASRAQLRSQQAQMAERELTLAKAERDLQRQKNLAAEEATTAETLQNAETAVKTARVQIQSLKASMEQLQASMRVEEANLKFTKIYAPMAGTVVSITARQGQTLNTNQSAPTILRIADLSIMTVQTQVSEADVSKLRGGMPVYFTTLGGQGRRWYGELKKIEPTPTVTNNVVLYNALFEVPNNNRSLMTSMTAQVFFVVAEAKDVLVVPMSALTIQRGPQGGNRGGQGGAGGSRAPGVTSPTPPAPATTSPAAPASGARGTTTSSVPVTAFKTVSDTVLLAQASPGGNAGERPRFDREAFQNMSEEERARFREQRRKEREAAGGAASAGPGANGDRPRMSPEAFQNMSEEERARFREQRRKEREQAQAGGSNAAPAAAAGNAAGTPQKRPAAGGDAAGPARAPAASGTAPANREAGTPPAAGAGVGVPRVEGARPTRGPRQAKVKVMAEDGTIEEREITIGISNRVHAEVLSGLKEGDRVIAGVREPERRPANTQQGSGLGQQNMGGPGGMPGGMPGGAGAGVRR
ncbi:efflux RND transporter periplasmic adaptor subunit [Hydrogenophaga laconesensis]|uniref:Macrolide-specific efflux system membrane fusion protein n=1 Tax=Hydrogenophaga laconesensis TaxID=1805971 RepID=A0ABU1V9R8_9BURK|nr:efflux RND transporter periplasmic adaptor subunit [Hydrogenophaga laconesensis]MDR7094203.1 macrolide-specific efflux system membrane fusion protein [Hydrogenophaga laconesensis]